MDWNSLSVVIGVCTGSSGIILGWLGRSRSIRNETVAEAGRDAALRMDVEYIKRSVADMRSEQRIQGQRFDILAERVTRIEESSKQANQRLDRLEAEN